MPELTVGTRIYYTGDMANMSSYGTITETRDATRYGPAYVSILYDEPRFEGDTLHSSKIPLCLFSPSPGRRFYLAEEWDSLRAESLAKFYATARHG